jgi:hypothetical protein
VPRGLLQKTLELINKLFPHQPGFSPGIDQEELDAPPATALSDTPVGTEKKSPESVPRTWKESGEPPPRQEEEASAEAEGLAEAERLGEAEGLGEAERHKRLWAELRELEDGIESPGRLFSLVKDRLQLNRAALLLYDPVRMVFAPWAVHGFDETTNHRLRIPLQANDTMNRLASGKVFFLTGAEELQSFQQFFSFREFSTLSTLLLVPFIHESKFMGLLLSAGLEADTDQNKLDIFETLSNRAAVHVYRARERHLEGAKRGIPERPESLRESVRAAIQPCLEQGLSPLMIRLSTGKLIESVRKQNPYIDSFRLGQDIARVVLSLFQSLGSVFEVDRERILVLVTNTAHPKYERDSHLLIYHLKATLGRLLPELADQERIELDERVRIPSPDIEEALTYLAEIV